MLLTLEDNTSIDRLGKLLAIESISNNQPGILDVFSRLIPKTQELITSFAAPLAEFVSPNKQITKFSKSEYRDSVKAVSKLPFMAYRDTLVMVPEGFTGNLVEYLKLLGKLNTQTIKQASDVVNDYINELSVFLNNLDARKSLKTHAAFYKQVSADRVKVESMMNVYFNKADTRSRIKLGSVIIRFGDFEELFTLAEQLQASATTKKELTNLLSQVNHASELLKLINEKLLKNEFDIVSGEVAKNISMGAYEVAKYVELISVLTFSTEVAVSCVNALAEQFKKITN